MAGQPNFPFHQKWENERLWAAIREIDRKRSRRPPNLRDLQDINGWGAADGHSVFYDTTTGKYKPMLAPPFLKFNYPSSGGTITVTVLASDEDPVAGAGKIINVNARLKVAGSSTTTAILKKNASAVITTFSFASGRHTPTWTTLANTTFAADDYFWVDLTAAGTGAAGLVIAAWATAA